MYKSFSKLAIHISIHFFLGDFDGSLYICYEFDPILEMQN